MATHLRTELVVEALEMAVEQRRPEAVVHHSDQGCQYTSLAFGGRCREWGVALSMGSVALGPGAEVLEVSGHHALRFGIVARVALPAVLAAVVLVVVGQLYLAGCVVAVACVAVELVQSVAAYRRVGLDCTVMPLLRDVSLSR